MLDELDPRVSDALERVRRCGVSAVLMRKEDGSQRLFVGRSDNLLLAEGENPTLIFLPDASPGEVALAINGYADGG